MSSQVHNENIVIVVDFNKKNEFQGPGFESRWRCMFFTLVVLRITDLYFRQKVNFG